MIRRVRLSVLLVGVLLGLALPAVDAQAPAPQEIRLVFIVNQSNNVEAHDSAGARFQAVQAAVRWLTQFYTHFLCHAAPQLEVYFTVLYFHQTVSVVPLNPQGGEWVRLNDYPCQPGGVLAVDLGLWEQKLSRDECVTQGCVQFGADYTATLGPDGVDGLLGELQMPANRRIELIYLGDGLACGEAPLDTDCELLNDGTLPAFNRHLSDFAESLAALRDGRDPTGVHFLGFAPIFGDYQTHWEAKVTFSTVQAIPEGLAHLYPTLRGTLVGIFDDVVAMLENVTVLRMTNNGKNARLNPATGSMETLNNGFTVPPLIQEMRVFGAFDGPVQVNDGSVTYGPQLSSDKVSRAEAWHIQGGVHPSNWHFGAARAATRLNLLGNDSLFVWTRPTEWVAEVYPAVGPPPDQQTANVYQYEQVRLVARLLEPYPYDLPSRVEVQVSVTCPLQGCTLPNTVTLPLTDAGQFSFDVYPHEFGVHGLRFQIRDLTSPDRRLLSEKQGLAMDVALLEPVQLTCAGGQAMPDGSLRLLPGDRLNASVQFAPSNGVQAVDRKRFPVFADSVVIIGRLVRRSSGAEGEAVFAHRSGDLLSIFEFLWNGARDDRSYELRVSVILKDGFPISLPASSCIFNVDYVPITPRQPISPTILYTPAAPGVNARLDFLSGTAPHGRQVCFDIPNVYQRGWNASLPVELVWSLQGASGQTADGRIAMGTNGDFACIPLTAYPPGLYTLGYYLVSGGVILSEPRQNGADAWLLDITLYD